MPSVPPHIGGPLERYTLQDGRLEVEQYPLGVTNHTLGSRNLDLGATLPRLEQGADHLALPSQNFRRLKLIRCTPETCEVVDEFELEGRLSSNVGVLENGEQVTVVAGDETGRLYFWQVTSN